MKPKPRTMSSVAALAVALLTVAPARGRACDFFNRLFGWSRRPEPVVVEPVPTPRFYLSDEFRTEAYYPSYGCNTQLELGTELAPAPPAENGYLESPPEKTFQEPSEQSSQKPAEPGTGEEQQPSNATKNNGSTPNPDEDNPQPPPTGTDGASQTSAPIWQPISRSAARTLLSRRTRSTTPQRRAVPFVRASHPGWLPVGVSPSKGLAAR
jgi:hypothetical protein